VSAHSERRAQPGRRRAHHTDVNAEAMNTPIGAAIAPATNGDT
jgi:hypothetical protein